MDSGIRPLWVDRENFEHRLTGVAITARYVPTQSPAYAATSHEDFLNWSSETHDRETPDVFMPLIHKGTVLIIEDSSASGGAAGFNDLQNWRSNGCLGVITSNTVRNTDEVSASKIPLYLRKPAHGVHAGRNQLESVNRPVVCGGVQVKPGDVIVADGDGVAVVPRGMAEKIIGFAGFSQHKNLSVKP
jgi:regulator of RNase E activity RraA